MGFNESELQAIATHVRSLLAARLLADRPFAFCTSYPKYTHQLVKIFWTASDLDGVPAPSSSVVRLAQFMATHRDLEGRRHECHFHVSSNYPMTPMCTGMVSFLQFTMRKQPGVAGAVLESPVPLKLSEEVTIDEVKDDLLDRSELDAYTVSGAGSKPMGLDLLPPPLLKGNKPSKLERVYMMATFALVAGRPKNKLVEGHNIGALLVSRSGEVLSWGLNQRNLNNSYHAELNTLQAYWKRKRAAPPGASLLFTTLKPCKMCAGMIAHLGIERIYVGQDDPGSHAQGTALDLQIPQRQCPVGDQDTKAVKVYAVNKYDVQQRDQGLTSTNLTKTLQEIHTGSKNPQITKTLNEDKEWWKSIVLTSRSLLRKLHKYTSGHGYDPIMAAVVRHVAPFVAAHGNKEFEALTAMFGQAQPFAAPDPVVDKMEVEDEPRNAVHEQAPQQRPLQISERSVPGMVDLVQSRLFWELTYSVGPLFEMRLSQQQGKFDILKGELNRLVHDMVKRDITSSLIDIWQYHEQVFALLVDHGDKFCRRLNV